MPIIPVRELHKGGGVNKDAQANSLPLNAFSEIVNGRFSASRLERVGETQFYDDSYFSPELTDSRAFFAISRGGNDGHLLITDSSVFYDIGVGWVDVTPMYAPINDSNEWSCEQYGDSIIITSLGNIPLVLSPSGSEFEPFVDWPVGYEAGKVFAYKNFLIAVNLRNLSNPLAGTVMWSDVVIDGDCVNVEWSNLTTNLAGQNILPDSSGVVLDGGVLKDAAILYTENTVWRMDATNAVAGTTPLVFNFRRVFADDGILRQRCFSEIEGRHFVIGLNNIYIHDGFTKQSISDDRVTRFFYGRLGTEGYAYVLHYPRPQEVMFVFASRTFAQANEAIVFNYRYGAFTRWIFSDTRGTFKYMAVAAEFDKTVHTWATLPGTWQDYRATSWDDLFPSQRDQVLYGLNVDDDELLIIDTDSSVNQTPGILYIERLDIDLKEVDGESSFISYFHRLVPLVTGSGTFRVQFGGRNQLGQPIQWLPPVVYTIGQDYKVDARVSYRYLAFRIEQTTDEGFLSLTGFDLHARTVTMR
jgi:hypothetical protein